LWAVVFLEGDKVVQTEDS